MDKQTQRTAIFAKISIGIIVLAMMVFAPKGSHLFKSFLFGQNLRDYPVQSVVTDESILTEGQATDEFEEKISLPTIYWDEDVHVEAVKCVKTGEGEVQIEGDLTWVSDDPRGRIVPVGTGSGPRGPGCINYTFENPVPPKIRAVLEELKANGDEYSEWHLSGEEIPIDKDGRRGVSKVWITTTFRVLHEDQPEGIG